MAKTYDPVKTPEYADLLKNIKKRITEAQYEAVARKNSIHRFRQCEQDD
jgi:hypothetical protein